MSGGSEEKTLPATSRKLEESRRKGQVASSSDFVEMTVLLAGLAYVLSQGQVFLRQALTWFDFATKAIRDPHALAAGSVQRMGMDLLGSLAPLLVIVAGAGVLANIGHKRGLVVSAEPLKPDLQRISISAGFGRIFSAKSATEFGITLLRCGTWFVAAGIAVWAVLPTVFNAATCGAPCVLQSGYDLLKTLLLIAVVILMVAGALDLPLQTAFFLKEMRMSHSEVKQEMKQMMGAPEVRSRRREAHQEAARGVGSLGQANVVVVSAAYAVALWYDRNEQPVPIVMAKGRGPNADRMIEAAGRLGVLVESDPDLAVALYESGGVGALVPQRCFDAVAALLLRTNTLRL